MLRNQKNKKEPRSILKHKVVPLGGFDFKIDKLLLQNEKVQDFNYLITADISKSQNLHFFCPKDTGSCQLKIFCNLSRLISSHLFKSSQIQMAIISALIVDLIITDSLSPQKHSGIKITCPKLQSVISHKNKNDRV